MPLRFAQEEFDQPNFTQSQFTESDFAQGEFSTSQFNTDEFTTSEFTRNQFAIARQRQLRFQQQAFERRQFEQRTFTLGDRLPITGQWQAVPPSGAPKPAIKLGNGVIPKGDRIELYPAQPTEAFPAPDIEDEIAEILSLANCRGYLNGQVFNCPEESEVGYGVVYAALIFDTGIVIGGDRPIPVLIEGAAAGVLQVTVAAGKTLVYWASNVESLNLWIDGETTVINEGFPAFLGAGWRDTSLIELLGGGVRTGQFLLSDHLGNVTTGNVSGTTSESGDESTFSGDRPILQGITRSCSVQQTDAGSSLITGSYDAHQSLMIRADGNRSLVMHRIGSITESGRSQTSRVYLIDREGLEVTVNSAPGLLISLEPVTPVLGSMAIATNQQFKNYIDGTTRPIFDALIGLPVVIANRVGATVVKGFGAIASYTFEYNAGSLGGTTTLVTATVSIERVSTVPFDGAISAGSCVLYSNSGSVIDFLLQSNIYTYAGGSGNLPGLGETGDLSSTVPLSNFNILGNNGVNGASFAQWVGSKIYVSDSSQTAQNLDTPSPAYADQWTLRNRDGVTQFIKSPRPLQSRRTAVTEEGQAIALLSSAFYPR